ncbi:MAG: aminotransferase class V-fold PLP-dependent enzyme [Acidimicrobiales bacterium]
MTATRAKEPAHPLAEPPEQRMEEPPEAAALTSLVGAGLTVPCVDGVERPYRDLDCAASTPAHPLVAERVAEALPWYASVHRGAGFKSRAATIAYEAARLVILDHCGRSDDGDVAIICRNTTEAVNHLAYRLRFAPGDVVVTTVVEHHANLLPWARSATLRYVECGVDGTFGVEDVVAALDGSPAPKLLAITGASNVTGWMPPIAEICAAAHARGVPVALDAAQLAPHRPLPTEADYLAFSGHKLYAPYGAGALVGPRTTFETGDPFLAGGGAVDLVDLDEVIWTEPPDREEAGSPNVLGAVAMGAALDALRTTGWGAIVAHERHLAQQLRRGLASIDGVRLLGPSLDTDTLAVATFTVEGVHQGLVAARLSAEHGIGVRHGCFCAHPYLLRLLGLGKDDVAAARRHVLAGDRASIPGAVRASCGLGTSADDVGALLHAIGALAAGAPSPAPYVQDPSTGDFFPESNAPGWTTAERPQGSGCAQG